MTAAGVPDDQKEAAEVDRQCSQFVKAEDFCVAPDSKDLYTSPRYTHLIRMPKNDYNRYVQNGYYLQTSDAGSDDVDPADSVIGEIEGVDDVKIHKKILKTGREIWTLGGQENPNL